MKLRYAAKAMLRRKTDGKYLVLWASKWDENPRRSQQPDLPGGLVEQGETTEEGLIREVREETGAAIDKSALRLAYAFVWDEDDVSTLFQAYLAEVDDIDVVLSWEHEKYAWLTVDEVLGLEIREPYPRIFNHMHRVGLLV